MADICFSVTDNKIEEIGSYLTGPVRVIPENVPKIKDKFNGIVNGSGKLVSTLRGNELDVLRRAFGAIARGKFKGKKVPTPLRRATQVNDCEIARSLQNARPGFVAALESLEAAE